MCSGCTECHYIQHCSGVSGSIRVNTMGWNIAGRRWPCDHGAQPELTHPFNPDPGPGLGDTMHHGNMVWSQPWSDNDPISVTQICNCYQAQFTPSQIGKLQWGSKKWQHFSHRNHPAIHSAVELGRDGSMGRIVCQCQNLSLCNNELVAISGIVALSHQYFINYVPTLVRISHTNQAWTLSGCSFQFHSNLKSSLITSCLSCHTVQCNAHLLML